MSLSIKGKITKTLDVESGTSKAGKEWKKQGFIIDTGDQYNPEVCFSLFGDEKISMLSEHKLGDDVEVSFNVSSREFSGKYYHNLDAWKIISAEKASSKAVDMEQEKDDLPF